MRLLPTRALNPAPIKAKPQASQIQHISAPLKGLNLSSKLTTGDPLTAPILSNFVVEDDRIQMRAGYRKVGTMAGGSAIVSLVPWYGSSVLAMLAGTNNTLCNISTGAAIKTGFTGNDWSWTSFANLGQQKYTVMVNGKDGVWSWDGTMLAAGIVKEAVTAPADEAWITPDTMNIVLVHMNRLFFADTTNLAFYYLPLQQKSGELKVFPLNAMFRRGGTIRAMYTWTLEGGTGINDQLVLFSSNGECVIYAGTDPDTDFQLVGIFRFDSPMSKHCIINYGGDLYVQVSTGLVPMSTMLQAESEQLGKEDRAVISLFLSESIKYRDRPGWETFINPSTGRVMCNVPQGSGNRYIQLVRHMPRPVWSQYDGVPARTWGWFDPYVYFGDDSGNVFQMHPTFQSDDGNPIRVDVMPSWSSFKTPGIKHFKMVKAYITTDAATALRPFIDVKVDYDLTPPQMQPDTSVGSIGSSWDTADWATDENYPGGADWAQGALPISMWNGVGALGRVGAPRLTGLIRDCSFAISGFDVIYEGGSVL